MTMLIVFLALLLTFAMTVGVVVVLSIWFDNIVVQEAYHQTGPCELHRLGIYFRLNNQKPPICNRG